MNTFAAHRKALMKRIGDGLVLLSGGREVVRNHDVNYVFRQGSNFLYLTGIEKPGCHLLLDPRRARSILFIPRIDNHHRVWEGHVPGPAESRKLYGIPRVAYSDTLPKVLKGLRRGYRAAYANRSAWKLFGKTLTGFKDRSAALGDALEELRAVKTTGELEFLARAGAVSAKAHVTTMLHVRPGMREFEIQAVFEAECTKAGLRHLAYPSIVAAGKNGAVLHYRENDARLRAGELHLIDAGAEFKGYAADITRTYPAGARFTRRQRDVYSIVLETQKLCIDKARPGINSADLHVLSMTRIAEGLRDLKLLKGEVAGLVEGGAVRLFYPHGIGHLLGLDVHDGLGGRRRKLPNPTRVPVRFVAKLEAGFVVTVEPGIYFISALLRDPALRRKHRASVDFTRAERFLDFGGVRIEDDVVVRPNGPPKNLTAVPKELEAIEALRGRACAR